MPLNTTRVVRRNVGRRIAELRNSKGQTQAQLAEQAEASVPYIARIEGGTENLTLDSLVKFANLFRVPVIAFFEPAQEAQRGPGRPPKAKPGTVAAKRTRRR